MRGQDHECEQEQDWGADLGAAAMCAVYRHDVHKLRARSHDAAAEEYCGVPVNESVPLGADGDAAVLSRPCGEPEQTVANHVSPYRLSLVTGASAVADDGVRAAVEGGFEHLVMPSDAEVLHARWVTSTVPAAFNEAVHYPYTSLKYHVLVAAALLDNYRAGHGFDDLWVVVENVSGSPVEAQGAWGECGDAQAALAASVVRGHRTVLWVPPVAVHVTGDLEVDADADADAGCARGVARLGARPARCFADVWSRLSAHPFGVDGDARRWWRLVDAELRRIRSWSVALQVLEERLVRRGTDGGEWR